MDEKLNLRETFPLPSYEEWKAAVIDSLKGADFDKVMQTKTYEGITLQPIYRIEDIADLPFTDNMPGIAPYLRGNDPKRFLQQGWLIAQSHDEPDHKKLNEEILKELNLGLSAVNIVLKHSDTKRGVSIKTQEELSTVFNGIDLAAAPLFIQMDVKDSYLMEMLGKYADEGGIDLSDIAMGVGFDPTGELAREGSVDLPLDEFWQVVLEKVKWSLDHFPHNRLLSLDGTVYEAAGASAVQELAYVLSTAIGLIQGLQYSGFSIEQLAPLFQVKLSLGSNFFMEIAKIRAFRLVWAEMIKAFGGNDQLQKVWIHGKTASFNKSLLDQYVNVLRTATEGFAGVIGGVDSLEIEPFDALSNVPDELSRRIARNQQVILNEEAHFSKVMDPAGGCYYIEALTNELVTKAWELMQDLESAGGMVRCLRAGKIHEQIEVVAQSRIAAVNKRKDVFVGVNMYANPLDKIDIPAEELEHGALAVTLEKGALPRRRVMAGLESLRARVQADIKNRKIFLLNLGSLAEFKARADFATGFFQVGGFEVISDAGHSSLNEAVVAAKASGAAAYCLCSTDDNYQNLVPELCSMMKDEILILAGYPTDKVDTYKEQGIDIFIHVRADLHDTSGQIAKLMEVK